LRLEVEHPAIHETNLLRRQRIAPVAAGVE